MKNINDSLKVAISLHSKLVRTLPMTNYVMYCRRVHASSSFTPSEKWDMILQWEINPSEYTNPTLFACDWQVQKFLSKLSLGGVPSDRDKEVAYAKFQSAEQRCYHANHYMTNGVRPQGLQVLLPAVSRIVNSVLGDVKDFFNFVQEYDTPSDHSSFDRFTADYGRLNPDYTYETPEYGPGISVGRDFKLQSLSEKLVYGTVTAQCAYLAQWISSIWKLPSPTIVKGSVLTFVPKRVGEARTICYEPSMNMLIQKLIGSYIKSRMKCVLGIDLTDQSKNKEMARLGSLCDSYATIDLSSASDLLSTWFVTEVTPYSWLRLLNDARSKSYFDSLKNEWSEFHKFSTMGNGFTFELETLLFAAITLSAVREFTGNTLSRAEYAIYGDDIIVPKDCALIVQQSLALCGHIPNVEKTFTTGPFRESCGGDYFNGWEVTPLKIKDLDVYETKNLVTLHNRCIATHRHHSHAGHFSGWLDRVRLALELRVINIDSRISHGPVESFCRDNGAVEYCSSDRYLWSEAPSSSWRNARWSRKLQSIVPLRYVVSVAERTIEYDVHPDVAPYAIAHGSIHCCRYHVNVSTKLKRNSSAFS